MQPSIREQSVQPRLSVLRQRDSPTLHAAPVSGSCFPVGCFLFRSSQDADAPQTTPTTAPISVQTGTGVWQSSAASTTIVITTASTGERCGAAFGTRTVCATPSAVCTSTSGQAFQTCSAVPKQPVLIGPPYPKSTVQCLDGSTYRGPMNQCNLPFPPSLGYASGFNYSQYLYVGRQPKFHIEAIAQLADQMVDPIISPGQPFSQHTHTFFGGSMINPNLTYEQLQNGSCSSVSVQADKSSYWIPSLYVGHAFEHPWLESDYRRIRNRRSMALHISVCSHHSASTTSCHIGYAISGMNPKFACTG